MSATVPDEFPGVHAAAAEDELRTPLLRWLRGSLTRRLFAAGLGDRIPDHWPDPTAHIPHKRGTNETYLRMATQVLDYVATELVKLPWADPTYPEVKVALRTSRHEPAVDDFGNQYLARRDLNGICHNCGQPIRSANPGHPLPREGETRP